jgi:hypothetical protein
MPEISVILLPWDVMGFSHFSYRNAFMSLKTSPRENMCSSLKSDLLIVGFSAISSYTAMPNRTERVTSRKTL